MVRIFVCLIILEIFLIILETFFGGFFIFIIRGLIWRTLFDEKEKCYGQIAGRSGLVLNHGIVVHNETIDSDYRGELGVILFNHSNKQYCHDWRSYCSIHYSVIHCNKVWFCHHIYKARHGEGRSGLWYFRCLIAYFFSSVLKVN